MNSTLPLMPRPTPNTRIFIMFTAFITASSIHTVTTAPKTFCSAARSSDLLRRDEKQPEKTGFLSRFSSLSANAKTVVIGMAAAFIAAVVLIVLLIIKLFGKNGIPDEDDEDVMFSGDFDNAVVSDAGVKDEEPEKEPEDTGNEEK